MIVGPAVILSSILFASVALALFIPEAENFSGDVNSEGATLVKALEGLFKNDLESDPTAKTVRNELIEGKCKPNDIVVIYARGYVGHSSHSPNTLRAMFLMGGS